MAQTRFIDPVILTRLSGLQLVAKTVVEGFVAGLHRSPYHGFSLDFAEYRQYAPGDDVRSVDWKVYARTDRFFVKKYQGDTNTRLYILLDTSKSMTFSSQKLSKLDYARFLAASLAYFASRQNDAPSLMTFDTQIRSFLPPRTRFGHFMRILHHLEHLQPEGETDISSSLEELAALITRRSMVVVISDFYQEVERISRALRFFHHRGNDVVIFHTLDPVELELPLADSATLRDAETNEQLPYSPQESRAAYLAQLRAHIEALRRECHNVYIDYELLNTEEPLDRALHRYLSVRQRRLK